MPNKYRLSASRYERETEDQKIEPKKVYFLSVEGNVTEKEYFENLSRYRNELGINAIVDVEVLKRSSKDGRSAPKQVLELLEEYLQLRESDSNMISDIPADVLNEYGIEFIKRYLDGSASISSEEMRSFTSCLKTIGYDINYRRYLRKYDSEMDEFCIMIDRDRLSHSEAEMKECVEHCRTHGYRCFIANPCFEFWLLLHLSDVETEYADQLDEILENRKISDKHTFVSNEVSKKTHHGKGGVPFKSVYLPHVMEAVERAKKFASNEEDLIESIGCNLWKLIEEMVNV